MLAEVLVADVCVVGYDGVVRLELPLAVLLLVSNLLSAHQYRSHVTLVLL